MASGRVGGTRSRVSGAIGSEVYRVIRNDDGTYTQIVQAKGEQTSTFTTPRLQAQRMVTAMVESMMKELKPVARISMQSGANKSKSLNAFSSFNLNRVAQDCKANWYGNNQFVYPRHYRTDIDIKDLGGTYLISAGTLQGDAFDELYHEDHANMILQDWPSIQVEFYGLKFNTPANLFNVGQFLSFHRMTRLDTVVFVGFKEWIEFLDPDDGGVVHYEHCYIIATINPSIPDEQVLNEETLSQLFILQSEHNPVCARAIDSSFIAIGFPANNVDGDETFHYWAGFTISYREGKKKISSSSYQPIPPFTGTWLLNAAPTNVFGSWIGEPMNYHYPSPFE